MGFACRRLRWVWALALLTSCDATSDDRGQVSHGDAARSEDPGRDAASMPTTLTDAASMPEAGSTPPASECVPGTQRVDMCLQPDPRCTTGGGFTIATCLPDGTLGPCECMPDPVPHEPPTTEDTSACLSVANPLFVDSCAACICTESKECAQSVAACQGACVGLTECLGSCLPDGGADIDCVVKCLAAYSPDTAAQFGMAIPNCIARCPDACPVESLLGRPDPDADSGAR